MLQHNVYTMKLKLVNHALFLGKTLLMLIFGELTLS